MRARARLAIARGAVIALAALAALAAGVAVTACGAPDGDYFGTVPAVRDPRHLRYCNQGEPEYLDPAMLSTTTTIKLVPNLFAGLTDFDRNGLPMPWLATRWEISDDLRRFTFHLRDDARWSDGRRLDAYDVAYHLARVLHPITASTNTYFLQPLKGQAGYTGNRVRVVLRDRAGLRAGDIVELVSIAGRTVDELRALHQAIPDSNQRQSHRVLALRDLGAAADQAYARVPPDTDVTVIELTGGAVSPPSPDGTRWAYVHWNRGDGVFGWVPADELEVIPAGEVAFGVRAVAEKQVPGRDGTGDAPGPVVTVAGRDLLLLPDVLGVRIPDPLTLIVETADPAPSLISITPSQVFRPTPRHVVSRWPRRWTEPAHIVTSGPMHLTTWLPRDRLELVRSPTFWDQTASRLDRLTVFLMDSQAASANYYYAGGCDAVAGNHIPASYLPVLRGEKRGGRPYRDFRVEPYLGIYHLIINTKRFPNVHYRRALAYAVDRAVIPGFLHGGQFPSSSYTPGRPIATLSDDELALCKVTRAAPGVAMILITGQLCYVPPIGLDFDAARARDELAQARRELGAAFPTHFTFKYNVGNEGHKLIAEYLQVQWKQVLGLDVSLETQEWKVYLTDTVTGNYDVGRYGWIGNYPDPEAEFLPLYRCESANNRPGWCDPRFEAALDAARPLRDRDARLVKAGEAERILLDEAPIIPLYVYTQSHLQKPYVRDLYINFPDLPPMYRAWLDPDWQAHAAEAR